MTVNLLCRHTVLYTTVTLYRALVDIQNVTAWARLITLNSAIVIDKETFTLPKYFCIIFFQCNR